MKRSDRAGPTTCSVTLFILMAVISQGMTVGNIAARADQLGPTFIEVGITETIKPTSPRQTASPGGPETGGEIVWAYGEIGALPAPGKPTAVMRQVPLNVLDSLGADFQTISTGQTVAGEMVPRHASFETTALHFGDPADLVAGQAAIEPRSPSTRGLPPKVTQAPLKKLIILPQQGGGLVIETRIVDPDL
jgi:hypothetical protein